MKLSKGFTIITSCQGSLSVYALNFLQSTAEIVITMLPCMSLALCSLANYNTQYNTQYPVKAIFYNYFSRH